MSNIEPIISGCLILASLWIIEKYLNELFERKSRINIQGVFPWVSMLVFQIIIEDNKKIPSLMILFVNIGLVFLICLTNYKGTIRNKVFYTVLLYVIWMAVEICLFQVFAILQLPKSKIAILGSIVSKIIMIIFVILLSVFLKTRNNRGISIKYLFVLLVVPLSSIFIAHNIFILYKRTPRQTFMSFISFILILLVNITIFEVCVRLAENYELQKENIIIEQQIKLMEKHMYDRELAMSNVKEMRHDLKSHLIYLLETVESNRNEEAICYIKELLDGMQGEKEDFAKSGNAVVDTLINYKCSLGKKYEITFRISLFIPMKLPIKEKDLCIILGNALDNAVEASKQCKTNKFVDISMACKNDALSIVIKNSYLNEMKKNTKGNIITTKADVSNHGLGLASIKKAVAKYNGEVVIDSDNNIFSLMILLDL